MDCVINAKFLSQNIGGTQQVGIGLSKYLKTLLANPTFVTTGNIVDTEMAKQLDAISIGRKKSILWEHFELPFFLRKNNNPLLIDFGNSAPIFYKNKVTTILDISVNIHPEWYSLKHRYYLQTLNNFYIKTSKKIITISNFCKEQIIDFYKLSPDFVEVVHCACPENIQFAQNIKHENPYGRYILGVSSIHTRKNFKGLIQAFKKSNLKNTKLIIVGERSVVSGSTELRNEIPIDNSVIFTGYVSTEQLVGLYKNALFFVYPSYFEGFGIPPLEAMAHGCPTIVSNTTSLPEVCGDASLYVNPYDTNSITDALITLANDSVLRNSLKDKGYERVKLFSWKKSAEKLAALIEKLN